jgi:tetratricopeptide (TPR) repeat protein
VVAAAAQPQDQAPGQDKQEPGTEPDSAEGAAQEQNPADKVDGSELLGQATELRMTASSTRDLDRVADLCEDAIAAGLDSESEELARQLWASALHEAATVLSDRVLGAELDRRWQFYRQQSLTRLTKAIELDPQLEDAYRLIVQLNLLPGGDRPQAREAIDKLIELAADDPAKKARAYVNRAQLQEDDEARRADLDLALETDPNCVEALRMRGAVLLVAGSTEEAISDFRRAVEAAPEDTASRLLLVQTLSSAERYDEALQEIEEVLKIDSELVVAYTLRAQIYVQQEKPDEALADLQEVISREPRNEDALLLRASLFYEQEKFDEALADVEQLLVFQPDLIRAIYMHAFILAALEKYDQALDEMRTLVESNPENIDWQLDMAMLYNAADQPTKAIEIYDTILEDDAQNGRALRGRGDARLSRGQHAEAIKDYEAALPLLPDDDGLLNNLAWVLATSPDDSLRDGQRAIELATKASELTDYQRAHILSTLASAYAEVGDFETAIKWATEAIAKGTPDRIENLKKELESYQKSEPWRERQNVEEKNPDAGGGKLSADEAEAPNPPAAAPPGKSDKSDSDKSDKDKKTSQ